MNTILTAAAAAGQPQPGFHRSGEGAGPRSDYIRIEKTVFIKAPRTLAYGEVARVMDGLKGTGASPIGLQLDDLK